MGTRGAFGFRINGEDKLTYNHYDSYPSGLGVSMALAVRENDDERLAGTALRLIPIDSDAVPTDADRERYAPIANLGVGNQSLADWYCLLREGQGKPEKYIDGTYDHLFNGIDFLADSLFCEWAYVVNMDTRTLEVYEGFNKQAGGAGRYAELRDGEYFGVQLVAEIPIDDIRRWSDDEVSQAMDLIESLEEAEA